MTSVGRTYLIILSVVPSWALAQAAADTAVKVTFGGFIDTYYAWDFNRPPTFDRSFAGGALFTTQPSRHNEFNVNLAFVEAKLDGTRVRGRLALQAGTSVQSNYAGESTTGAVSGPLLARHIQEAFGGARVSPTLWVDAGIFYSNMGMEGWVSRDNPTYTRSLVADYSPYYSSGVRGVWQASPKVLAQLHVVNGWQNISENNTGKGAGIRVDVAATSALSVSYYNFFSDEGGNRLRTFNGGGAKLAMRRATVVGELDVGTQAHSSPEGGTASWWGSVVVGPWLAAPTVAFVARVEAYDDRDQIIIGTGAGNGPLRASGGSLGIDLMPQPQLVWRTELRGFRNKTGAFPNGTAGVPRRDDAFVVTSLGVTF